MKRATVCLAILILSWMVAGSILAGTRLTQVSVDQAKEMIQGIVRPRPFRSWNG